MNFLSIAWLLSVLAPSYFAIKKLREIRSVSLIDFARRLFNGDEERDMKAGMLQKVFSENDLSTLLIDLRESDAFEKEHIADAISLPFNDFMHEVLVNEKYDPKQSMILICDHGLKSKVAADILGEDEGFSSVYSVHGGMEAWNKLIKKEPCCAGFMHKEGYIL